MYNLGFKETEELEIKLDHIHWIMEKPREFQNYIYFCLTDYVKALDCVDHNKLWKILQQMKTTRPPDLPPEKSLCRSGSNS